MQHTPTEGNLSLAFYSMHTCRTAGYNINIYRNQRPGRIYHTFKIHFPHLIPLSGSHFPLSFFKKHLYQLLTAVLNQKVWSLVAEGEQGCKHMPSFSHSLSKKKKVMQGSKHRSIPSLQMHSKGMFIGVHDPWGSTAVLQSVSKLLINLKLLKYIYIHKI